MSRALHARVCQPSMRGDRELERIRTPRARCPRVFVSCSGKDHNATDNDASHWCCNCSNLEPPVPSLTWSSPMLPFHSCVVLFSARVRRLSDVVGGVAAQRRAHLPAAGQAPQSRAAGGDDADLLAGTRSRALGAFCCSVSSCVLQVAPLAPCAFVTQLLPLFLRVFVPFFV